MNVVTERNFDQVYSQDVRDAYWEQVARSLERVFGQNRTLADTYRQEIERAPLSEQILVYHQEPLEVAADLAGVDEITPDQQQIYIDIAGDTEPPRVGWPDKP
jgi:hypothetical protein